MRKLLLVGLIFILAASGCATPMDKTQQGTLIGTGVGAATGAALGQAIGRDTTSTLLGAAAGALAGGIAGAAIGSYMDRQEQELRYQLANVEAASIQRDQDVLAVTFRSDVMFDVDSAVLKPGGYDEIDRVAAVLTKYPQTRIQVEGHTDSTGNEFYNQQLSERRAQAVAMALQQRGVHPSRIQTIGFGETKPIASNDNPGGRQLNRRVMIQIVPIQA